MKRVALMIGIDRYENLDVTCHLRGAVNDQTLLSLILIERFGFQKQDVELLTDSQATRTNMLNALDRLAGMGAYDRHGLLNHGDLLFISYSGYGSRLKEPPGEQDEPNGYDPTIVPYDSDRPRPLGRGGPNLDITDDEIFARLERIKERAGHVVLFFDSSHEWYGWGGDTRSLPPDDRYADVPRLNPFLADKGHRRKTYSGWLPLHKDYLLIAACHADQEAYEYQEPMTGQIFGALTYHFVREMARVNNPMTYWDFFQPTEMMVNRLFPSQTPQISWSWNRKPFEIEEAVIEAVTTVLARLDDRRVRLAAGVAQGVTVGSLWQILPPKGKGKKPLADVIIRLVAALESSAESDSPLPAAVNSTCRAIEVERALDEMRMCVAVEAPSSYAAQINQLQQLIDHSKLLKLVQPHFADMIAVLLSPRSESDGQAKRIYAPELGAITIPTWVIVGRDKHLVPSPPHSIDKADALHITFENLETWARYLNTHRIKPIGADPLRGLFTAQLERENEWEEFEPLAIHHKSGLPLIVEGDYLCLTLENHYTKPLYYVLFSMDALGGVVRIWPPPGAYESLFPYDSLPLGLPIELPEHFPEVLDGGRETIKVMVTLSPATFDTMQQGMTRSHGIDEPTEIEEWFGAAMRGHNQGNIRPLKARIDEETWTVIQLDYYLKRT